MGRTISACGLLACALLAAGCSAGRYVSADSDLEELYVGKSYYEIVDDFGRPDGIAQDGMEGTKLAYNFVSLTGTRAAGLYRSHTLRNRITKNVGTPSGGITFSLNAKMKCYAVDSDFQRERVKESRQGAGSAAKAVRRSPERGKPQIPRTLEFPYVEGKSPYAEPVTVEKVEVTRESTTIRFRYRTRTPRRLPLVNKGVYIMPDVYIEDCATGRHYALTGHEGVTLYPERTQFARNQGGYDVLFYTLTFKPLDENTEYINIVEPGHSGYNFYGVDVRTPMATTEDQKKH